ncbi:MAG: histidine kinase [candidate division KSB1 bacterium]|nr:histidine kinase [candidate division KSB1 bacterium]MDZ7311210.1 histidine kinase [candidate division KSB1 bacterium]
MALLFLTTLVAPFPSPAQKLPFKNYSTKDGLVHNEARCIYQDSRGYLWIGTTEGISRFDGATFTNYILGDDSTTDQPEPLITFVNTFFEDKERTLWIGLNFWGDAARFNPLDQSFTRYKVIPNRDIGSTWVNTILQDTKGTLWFGTDDGLFTFANGAFRPFTLDTTDIPLPIRVLYEDQYRTIWIATYRGLYRYKNELGVHLIELPNLNMTLCNAIYEDKEGNLWIATDDIGLVELENHPDPNHPPTHLKTYTSGNGLPSNSVHDILQDDLGNFWIATWVGLGKFTPSTNKFVTYTTANGLPSDNLSDMLRDQEGNLWLATTMGISKLSGETFTNFGESEGLPTEFLTQIIRGVEGTLWFVGDGGACYLMGDTFVPIEALRGQYVTSAAADTGRTMWFGTKKGVVKWANGKILSRYTTANGLPYNHIQSVFQDSRGALWFGHEKGVSRLWRGRFRHFHGQADRPLVVAMTEDKNGTIWFATYRDGVYKISVAEGSQGNWVKVDIPVGFRTRAIFCDQQNKIWIATRLNGVFRYDPPTGALVNYTTADGLSSNFVRSIFQDSRGNFWFGTARGVNRFDGTTFRQYSTREGLAGDAVFACVEDNQGYLWFATGTGLSRYDPAQDRIVTIPPPVYITRFRILGREVPLRNGMDLPASQRSVSFEYVGISFKDETQVRYQYRLQGFDQNWSEVTDRRYVNYTNLSPGRYTFEVRARNGDGVWSVRPATFSFSIATPIWRRWWFIGLMIVVIGVIVGGVHRYRLNKLLEMERMRSRIATDLHDEIGTSLSSIALFSEMARNEILSIAPKVADKMKDVAETARQLVETMRDIVWAINPANDTVEDVVLYMKQFAAEVLEAKGIEFSFVTAEELRGLRLSMETRHHLYLIFKEAINNLVRHSGACHADIRMNLANGMLMLSINDNGKGFDKSEPSSGNGLKNMRKRAQAINATLTIDSVPGKGTSIALRMPI